MIGLEVKMVATNDNSDTEGKIERLNINGVAYGGVVPRKNGREKIWKPTFPEQIMFFFWFCVIMGVWAASSIVAIVAMISLIRHGTLHEGFNFNYVANGGIVALLLIASKWIMPLMKKSFDSSMKVKNEFQSLRYEIIVNEMKKM